MIKFSSIRKQLMVGFQGHTLEDPSVKILLKHIQKGYVQGVILFSYNIESPKQLKALTRSLKKANPELSIAIDQEGGKVQRLKSIHGFPEFPSAEEVARTRNEQEAYELYYRMANTLKDCGITINFAPVVDLKNGADGDECPIGAHERSFAQEPEHVIRYASAFVKAHRQAGILTTLKHFPGLGFARGDTHVGLVDITETFQPEELIPFQRLVQEQLADCVMVGHVMMRKWDLHLPATLSSSIISKMLRQTCHFNGRIIADDLQMGALAEQFSLEERVIKALQAGCDVLLFSNNPAANKGHEAEWTYDSDLPVKIIEIIRTPS